MIADLPHCDELFVRFFLPHYSESDTNRYQFGEMTRPDMMSSEYPNDTTAVELSPLTDEGQTMICDQIDIMTKAAISDFERTHKLSGTPDFTWLESVDDHYNEAVIAKLIKSSDPTDDSNDYKIICIEFGLLVAHLLQKNCSELTWIPDSPYWESSLLHAPTQNIIPPVHWGIKKMSDYGWDDGFVAKCEMCIDLLASDAEINT